MTADLSKEKACGRLIISLAIPIYLNDEAFEQALGSELEATKEDARKARQFQLQKYAESGDAPDEKEVN